MYMCMINKVSTIRDKNKIYKKKKNKGLNKKFQIINKSCNLYYVHKWKQIYDVMNIRSGKEKEIRWETERSQCILFFLLQR